MTDPDSTVLLLIVDRSGSMTAIRDEMVGSLTALVQEQARQPGRLTVDVVTFDDRIETTHVGADPTAVAIDLVPRGMTALLDAVGTGVTRLGERLAALPEHRRPETVLVVVATDGFENASRSWSAPAIRALVEHQRSQYSWDFLFLGAAQDAVATGDRLGFARESSIDFDSDGASTSAVVRSASAYLTARRSLGFAAFSEADRRNASRRRR